MRTSLSLYANAGLWLGRAVPNRPPPQCGGGTGRGVQQARHFFVIGDPTNAASLLGSLRRSTSALGASSPPPPCPSPTSPTWGEGTVWHAPSQLSAADSEMCASPSAFAGTTNESHHFT